MLDERTMICFVLGCFLLVISDWGRFMARVRLVYLAMDFWC